METADGKTGGGCVFLDVGGTRLKSAAYAGNGERLGEIRSVPSLAKEGRETILEHFLAVIAERKAALESAGETMRAVGFAFPGPFDYPEGVCRIRGLDKYEALYGVGLREALARFPGQRVIAPETRLFFRNDLTAFGLGEAYRSLCPGTERVFCLCIGTGAGSAFLEKGKVLTADPRIPEEGWIYPFPLRGATIDDWISARGLRKLSEDAGFPKDTIGEDLYRLAEAGDPAAREVWLRFGALIAEGVAPFIRSFQPQTLLLGGQISGARAYFEPPIRAAWPGMTIQAAPDTTESIFRGLWAAAQEEMNHQEET